jgi:hypothetical protein
VTTAELVNNTAIETRQDFEGVESPRQTPLFDEHEGNDLRTRWQGIQGEFVDDPKASVERADELVANSIKRLAEIFAAERSKLEATWSKGFEASTEDLRQALRRYRSFFDRLLSI